MDLATLIGLVVAGGLVAISIVMGGSGAWFIDYPSLMIVIGGTMGATSILAIQGGDNHRIVEQKLKAFLSPTPRAAQIGTETSAHA